MTRLAWRGAAALLLVIAVVGSTLAVGPLADAGPGAGGPPPGVEGARALDVDGQNHLDHQAHRARMLAIAKANGLEQAPGGGRCGDWLQFRTSTGLHCSPGPMTKDMFTAEQLKPAIPAGPATGEPGAAANGSTRSIYDSTPKVTCFTNGTDGKRVQMVYARRANHPDRYVSTALQVKQWAVDIDDIMLTSARKTNGSRRVRWVTDSLCSVKVLNMVLPNTVTTFTQMEAALEAKGLTSKSRKYLVAWDDGDSDAQYCGLGAVYHDSQPGSANLNETSPSAQFAGVEDDCWSSSVAAHELMHTLGAVQNDAPNASGYGHCTDDNDIMCYSDGPGVVMRQICSYDQEDLYDCRNDDYFSTSPSAGSYLATHWNTANSGWLDKTLIPVAPGDVQGAKIKPGAESVTVSWSPPVTTGGSAILAYEVTFGAQSKVVPGGTLTATVTGLPDGTTSTGYVRAINAVGPGPKASAGSATPTARVTSILTTPDGETAIDMARGPNGSVYVARPDRIVRVDPNGTQTAVVQGPGSGEGTPALATDVHPGSIAARSNGEIYWYDTALHTIRRLKAGVVDTVAGNGTVGTAGDGGPALSAELRVTAITVGTDPGGAESSMRVYALDKVGNVVRAFAPGGTISTVAGVLGQSGLSPDATLATSALFNSPSDIAADASGRVYVADTGNNRVRYFLIGSKVFYAAGNGGTTLDSSSAVFAKETGVPAPKVIDWSAEQGLIIESGGMIRGLLSTSLYLQRLAGDPFTAGASDADGTPASDISYRKADSITAVVWSNPNLHVLTAGTNPSTSAARSRVRSALAITTSPVVAPSPLVAAPHAVAGGESATVTWVPASNGGSMPSYTVTASPGGAHISTFGDNRSATFTGLTGGTTYTFKVKAYSYAGVSADSPASNAVVPRAIPLYLPFGSWTDFVNNEYLAVMGRGPRSDELSKAVSALSAGTTTKAAFVVTLRRSSENQDNVDPVARLYRAFLGRTPDAGGLQFWIKRRRTGTWTLTRMADSFAASSEFKTKYGSLTNRQFVTRIYTDVLQRTADTSGVNYWTGKLDARTKTRGGVMVSFSESSEYKRKQASYTDIAAAFILLLQHAPDPSDEASWWAQLEQAGTPYSQLIADLLGSDEYYVRISG